MKDVPFHPNEEDNLHCMQSCVLSVLDFYNVSYEIDEVDFNTGFFGGPSWSPHAVNWLNNKGLSAKLFSIFDYSQLVSDKENYLRSFKTHGVFEKEKREGQYEHLDEVILASDEMVNNGSWDKSKLSIPDLAKFLKVSTHIAIAKTMTTYLGGIYNNFGNSHFVTVLEQYSQNKWIIHDSGLPPIPYRKVPQTIRHPGSDPTSIFGEIILIKKIKKKGHTKTGIS